MPGCKPACRMAMAGAGGIRLSPRPAVANPEKKGEVMAESSPPGGQSDCAGNGANIDTSPIVPRPPRELVESAAFAIPGILADVQPNHDGAIELVASNLVNKLRGAGHNLAAAQWAVHEAVQAGRLKPGRIEMHGPISGSRVGGAMRWVGGADDRHTVWTEGKRWTIEVPIGRPAPFESFKVIATEQLWEWWRTQSEAASEAKPESDTMTQVNSSSYDTIKARLCRFMQERFLDRSSIGAIPNFAPSELLSTEHGFVEADKRHLIRAFVELNVDGIVSFGVLEMAPASGAYDPWFNRSRRVEILSKVLKLETVEAIDPNSCIPSLPISLQRLSDGVHCDTKAVMPLPVRLVTRRQIAELAHLEAKSMTPFSNKWGTPTVPHSGKRPAKWDLNMILPILKQQFSHISDDLWDRLKDVAELA